MNESINIEPYRISQHGEPYLYSISRDTFERQQAQAAFQTILKDRLETKDTFYIVLGTDGGLLVDYLLEKGLPYGSKYIFIDLPNVVESIQTQLSFTKWDSNVAICTFDRWQEVAEDMKIQSFLFTEKVEYIKSVSAIDGYDSQYYDLDDQLALTIESIKFQTLAGLSRRPFMKRQIENLSDNIAPLKDLENRFDGKTCIILGGGPSLNNDVNWIKDNRENIVVIAVSRVAKKLLNDKLTPDFIFSVDPHDVSFDVSKEMLNLPESVIFVHSNYVVPTLSSQWRGRQFYFGSKTPWKSKLNSQNISLQGPTVTNSALSAAMILGFKRILLTGVDLCFAQNGVSHATGSNEEKVGPRLSHKGQWVETYSGELAETFTSFLHATHILANQGQQAAELGVDVINLSANAAKIESIRHELKENINLSADTSVTQLVNSIPNNKSQSFATNKQIQKEIDKLLKELGEVNKIAEKAIKDNSALYKTYASEEKNHQIKIRIDRAEHKLNTKFEQTTLFLKRFGIRSFIKVVRTDTDQDWSDEEMEETGRIYYQAFIDTINDIKPILLDAKKRISARIEEDKPTPSLDKIFEQWEEDKLYARAKMWSDNNQEKLATLPGTIKKKLTEFEERNQSVIANTDTMHLKRTQSQSNLNHVNRKIVYLYRRRNKQGLEQLLSNLENVKREEPKNAWMWHLCVAYLAMLNKNNLEAYKAFNDVDERLFTEDEAIHMASISIELGEIDTAEHFMKKLANLADKHKPRYAKLLKIKNEFNAAEQVYLEYVEANPHDVNTSMELVKFYLELGTKEQATIHLENILQVDPQHNEAKSLLEAISQA